MASVTSTPFALATNQNYFQKLSTYTTDLGQSAFTGWLSASALGDQSSHGSFSASIISF